MAQLERFHIHVEDQVLKDLKERLEKTRFAPDLDNEDMKYGLSTTYIKGYIDHWLNKYDWRKAEAEINSYNQHRIMIDGTPVHFIYEKSKLPNAIPIILTHGWPWTFWMWKDVIAALTNPASVGLDTKISFDVVIPSLLGFGFSTPLTHGDMNHWKMADIFHKLMTDVLGYKTYAAGGSDYGSLITSQLGHKYASNLYGIHLGQPLIPPMFNGQERPWDLTGGHLIPPDVPEEIRKDILKFQNTYASHVAVHMLDAQTLTHGLNYSPVAMLSWILKRWKTWSDKNGNIDKDYSKDEILTHAMIYWVNEAIGSSIRAYKNANIYPWVPSHDRKPQIEAPTGFTFLIGDAYPPGATLENAVQLLLDNPPGDWYNRVYAKAHQKGGHFGPWENPEAWIDDLRENFHAIMKGR